MNKSKAYASVWDALADTPEQAANLRARADLKQMPPNAAASLSRA
jgi:predicted XRE-type DNA-binding protein